MADSKFQNNDKNNRFHSKTPQEIIEILDGRNSNNTKRATKSNIKIFHDYLVKKSLPELHDITKAAFPSILEEFYPNCRRVNGEDYKLQSLKCIHAGINRWTKANRNLDIIADPRFSKANEIFKGVSKIATTKSYPVIEQQDLERIVAYFLHDIMNEPNPRKLQKCVLFYIIYFFIRRGCENLYEMQMNTFEIGTDPDGRQYIFQAIDEFDKNHRINDTESANQGRIYELPGT